MLQNLSSAAVVIGALRVNQYRVKICCLLFTSAAYIQVQFRLDFIKEANTMNPNQTVPMGATDLGPYCLQCRLLKRT